MIILERKESLVDCAFATFKISPDLNSSLFLHPFEGPGSLVVQEKPIGAQNYRYCRRSLEIGLSTKRNLGFIKDEHYLAQRSLLSSLLPSVETACALLQQKESQTKVFSSSLESLMKSIALYSKTDSKK
nr:serine carboxypeptidase S28 family protein [Tanacetum cinerariifolium]